MTLLIAGILLWSTAHTFRRLFPDARAALALRLGPRLAKGLFALVLLLAIVLMVIGYRQAPYIHVYTPPAWTIHLNNLLMFVAFALLGMGHAKGRSRAWFRHPMLMGVTLWAFAHILVNGHLAAVVLFLGMAAWANVHMAIINLREGPWQRPAPGTTTGDLRLLAITLALFAVASAVHAWLGVWPFPR